MSDELRGRVLVVDDDPDLADVLRDTLELAGYEAIMAHHGGEALAQIEQHEVDLVLLDMRMPVMDGWEFAERFHALDRQDVPIIVVTAGEDPHQAAQDVAAADWLAKPFDIDDLLARVKAVLQGRPLAGGGPS